MLRSKIVIRFNLQQSISSKAFDVLVKSIAFDVRAGLYILGLSHRKDNLEQNESCLSYTYCRSELPRRGCLSTTCCPKRGKGLSIAKAKTTWSESRLGRRLWKCKHSNMVIQKKKNSKREIHSRTQMYLSRCRLLALFCFA